MTPEWKQIQQEEPINAREELLRRAEQRAKSRVAESENPSTPEWAQIQTLKEQLAAANQFKETYRADAKLWRYRAEAAEKRVAELERNLTGMNESLSLALELKPGGQVGEVFDRVGKQFLCRRILELEQRIARLSRVAREVNHLHQYDEGHPSAMFPNNLYAALAALQEGDLDAE